MNARIAAVIWVCAAALLVCFNAVQSAAGLFQATPLADFKANELYLGRFPGLLYTDPVTGVNANTMPAQHAADGRAIAARVVPLDATGKPSATGKIGVVGIGMSNWNRELCQVNPQPPAGRCWPQSFLAQAFANAQVNHSTLAIADCALGGQDARDFMNNQSGSYTTCVTQRLPMWGLTAQQVEVVLWKNTIGSPANLLTPASTCLILPGPNSGRYPDACLYERAMGLMARFLRTQFPNVKQLFVHTRVYAGYATSRLDPEPFSYEMGFSTKWFVNAQIAQVATGRADPVAGDLDYRTGSAPWIAWGPYWWAAGTTPCRNCEMSGQTWAQSDFIEDGTHPSFDGVSKVAENLLHFYLESPYTLWFRAR